MTFEQIIQQVGKEIELNVLYEENGVASVIGYDNIKRAKITFNCGLTGSVMNGIELELYTALPDVPITLSVTAKFGEDTATKLYQNYHFKEAPTYNADSKTYTHILYDEMINLMVEYQPITINYPTTLIQYFQAFVSSLGLTTNISSLPNGNRTITQDPYTGINYTYRDALDDIGQATGTLFKVDNTQLIKCNLGTTAKVINDDILKNQNISMGKHYGPINVIVLSRAGGSDNIYYPETLPENPIEYKISDNILMNNNDRDTYLPNLYSALGGIEYDIYDCQLVGYGGFEPLDRIQIQTYEGNTLKTYNSYVFNNEIVMNGGGYEESVYTELPEETNTEYQYADTTDRRLNQTYLIVDKQNQSITSVISEVDGQNTKINKLEEDVDGIISELSNITGMTMTKEGYGSIEFTDDTTESWPVNIQIKPTSESICNIYPNFSLYPATQDYPAKVGLVPSGTLTPSSSLVPATGYPAQHIIYPRQIKIRFHNRTTNQDIDYPLPYDLLYYDALHYDEFYLNNDDETCYVKKRCKFNADGTIGLLESEEIKNITPYPEIGLSEGKYTITIPGFSGFWMSVELMAQNIYTGQFYTKHEVGNVITRKIDRIGVDVYDWYTDINGRVTGNSTSINVTAQGLETEVRNRQTADTQLSTKIKQTATSISLTAEESQDHQSCGLVIKLKNEDGDVLDEQDANITLTGKVSFAALSGTGTTTINGANIMTGTIQADKLSVTNLSSVSSDLGDITGGSLNIGNGKFKVTSSGELTSTSGNINLGSGKLKLTNGGSLQYYDSPGFIYCGGNTTSHPYVSALNVATQGGNTGGVVFRDSSSRTNAGNPKAGISYSSTADKFLIEVDTGNMNVDVGRHMHLHPMGYFRISSGNANTPSSLYSGSTYIYAQESVSLNAKNGHVYAGAGGTSNSRIAVDSSGPSSRCLKKNIKNFKEEDYKNAIELLNEIDLYKYNYKYKLSDKKDQYGFIIDDLLDNEKAKEFLYFKDDKAVVKNGYFDYQLAEEQPDNKDIIEFKRYDEETLIKYLLVVCKALQKEIEELKK